MSVDLEALIQEALDVGFSNAGALNVAALQFMPEVREMCNADRCRQYGKNWRCPPACGSIEEATRKAAAYSHGVLVQTTGQMADEFDYETMQSTGEKHKEAFAKLVKSVRTQLPDLLPMGAGTCSICPTCTYPDAPCRFPDQSISSMEAYGLWVSRVCQLSGLPYHYGKNTVTYTSCYLF